MARHLDNLGLSVHILLFADRKDLVGDAKINFELALKSLIPIAVVNKDNFNAVNQEILSNADWVVDALFGTGLQGNVRSPYDTIIQTINELNARVLSIDIPSGLDCDSGEPLGLAVKATHTVTFVRIKQGFTNPAAKQFLGHVHVVGIGIPRILMV